ncbi:hypothetical protein ACFYYB_05180 [Streptomyces sp. NPDC002886]|uniref:hypothetical protein n=1 Tax=Streptomyces sp. NPDC002886 TaxID=3364667 RepID=UPI00368770DC
MGKSSGDDLNFGQKVIGGLIGTVSNVHIGSFGHGIGGPVEPANRDTAAAVAEVLRTLLQN